jgi:hypothetical protein
MSEKNWPSFCKNLKNLKKMAARDQESFSLHIIQTERDGPKRRRENGKKREI